MSKNLKILIGVIVVLVVALLILTATTSKKTGEEVLPSEEGEVLPLETVVGDVGAMTDALYVEIMARNVYEQEKDIEGWITNDGWSQLLQEYGVTQNNFEAFIDQLTEDPVRFQELQERWYSRYLELTGEQEIIE